jgi:hypothetical protein
MGTEPSTPAPAELCGYAVVDTLADGASYLAIGPGGRGVVLKRLEADCLHGSLLHPDVRDRLSRVRELAHAGVANLFGVGKSGNDAWLIWEYVEGKTFDEYARDHCRSPRDLALFVREMVLTVESLHLQGIVHGALQGGNVIVVPDGSVRLTHISPYLYSDPADDAEAIEQAVANVLEERGERAGPLGRLLADARETRMPLRVLATRLAGLADARETPPAAALARQERRTRKRALVGALVVALASVAAAYGAWHAAGEPGGERVPTWLSGLR